MGLPSYFDDRTLNLNNRIAGWWFTRNRTKTKIIIETIGRSMAMTMRVFLRKMIGTETYTFWMVMVGFLWLRLCMCISIPSSKVANPFGHLVNPLAFHTIETSILNVSSLIFLAACIWYVIRTEFYHPKSGKEPPDVLDRGDTNLLQKLIDEDKSIFRTESVVKSAIAPLLFMGSGVALWYVFSLKGFSVYLTLSSFALLIDEVNYHRAVIRKLRLTTAQEIQHKKQMKKHNKRRGNMNTD